MDREKKIWINQQEKGTPGKENQNRNDKRQSPGKMMEQQQKGMVKTKESGKEYDTRKSLEKEQNALQKEKEIR